MPEQAIPDLITPDGWWARLRYKTCPACACGMRFPNGRWQMSLLGYPLHYATAHLGISPFRRPS